MKCFVYLQGFIRERQKRIGVFGFNCGHQGIKSIFSVLLYLNLSVSSLLIKPLPPFFFFFLQWQHDWQGQATLPHLKLKITLRRRIRHRGVFSQPPPPPPPLSPRPSSDAHTYIQFTLNIQCSYIHTYIQKHTHSSSQTPPPTPFFVSVIIFFFSPLSF